MWAWAVVLECLVPRAEPSSPDFAPFRSVGKESLVQNKKMSTPGQTCKLYRVLQEAGITGGGRGGDVQLAAFEALQVACSFRLMHPLPCE